MIKKILLILAAAILLLVIVVSLRPSHFTVTRSATIPASPEVVFAQVNDFHKWQEWSPWAKMDPACKFAFSGPESGVGAGFSWDGMLPRDRQRFLRLCAWDRIIPSLER